jgi:hypothetical protein
MSSLVKLSRQSLLRPLWALAGLLGWLGAASAADFYAATNGLPGADGSFDTPLDLATALSVNSLLRPGDTLWLRGGVYQGPFGCHVNGTTNRYVTVRQQPGERAIIDSALGEGVTFTNYGSWVTFRDFEVTSTRTNRAMGEGRPAGIFDYGQHTRLINLVVHSTGLGIGSWQQATNSEVYGCVVFHVGYMRGTNDGNGHSFYMQHGEGTKRVHDNLVFNSYGFGFNIYTEDGFIRGFDLQGNIAFNAGSAAMLMYISSNVIFLHPNIFIGGDSPAARITLVSNCTYHVLHRVATGVLLNYGTQTNNVDLVARDNYVVGGNRAFVAEHWQRVVFSNNTVFAQLQDLVLAGPFSSPTNVYWDRNRYFGGDAAAFVYDGGASSYAVWLQRTAVDSNSVHTPAPPTGTQVFLRPNRYEARRAHLAVYNWDDLDNVTVDVGGLLQPGDPFEVRNAQNYFGPPVLAGTFAGAPLVLPMTNLVVTLPFGDTESPLTPNRQFNSFVLQGRSPNKPPRLAGLRHATAPEDTPPPTQVFTVEDDETPATSLAVSAFSSDTVLLPPSGVVLAGIGRNHSLALTPAPDQSGTTDVSVVVNDGLHSVTNTIRLTVTATNDAPRVNAGTNLVLTLGSPAMLNGSATDDGTNLLAYAWGQVSGPGTVSFLNATSPATSVTLTSTGTYVLNLSASDGTLTGSNQINVLVVPSGVGPVPVISAVTVRELRRTNATLSFAASLPADGQIEFGPTSVYGQFSTLAAAPATNHLLQVDGLTPGATYHCRARARTVAGALGVSGDFSFTLPDVTTDTLLYQPALVEAAALTAPMAITNEPGATGGTCIGSTVSGQGAAVFTVHVPAPALYTIWARVLAPSAARDTFHVSADGTVEDIFDIGDEGFSPVWRWVAVNGRAGAGATQLRPRRFTWEAGTRQVTFRALEAGTLLDRLLITNDPQFLPADGTPVGGSVPAAMLTNLVVSVRCRPGYTYLATPFALGSNRVDEFFPTAPEGTLLFIYDVSKLSYGVNRHALGAWEQPAQLFPQGNGAVLQNVSASAFRLPLRGTYPLTAPARPRRPFFDLVSSPVPKLGRLSEVLDTPLAEGDVVYKPDPQTGGMLVIPFQQGRWAQDPVIDVCEAFFLFQTFAP